MLRVRSPSLSIPHHEQNQIPPILKPCILLPPKLSGPTSTLPFCFGDELRAFGDISLYQGPFCSISQTSLDFSS